MDACKPFSIKLDKNILGQRTVSPTVDSTTYSSTPDDSGDDDDDDLPPIPFTSPIKPVSKGSPATPPRIINSKCLSGVTFSPVNDDSVLRKVKLEKERKHHLVQSIVKRDFKRNLKYDKADALLEEHFKQGGIVAKRAKVVAAHETSDTTDQPSPDVEQDFNSPSGLSVFVNPAKFVADIEAPPITNGNDPFEADLSTAPPNVLRELVISNNILSMFCQTPVPVTIIRWLMSIMLMSNDKLLSQAAFSTLTCLLHQAQTYSLPHETFHIKYSDVVKIIVQFGASVDNNGDIQSNSTSRIDFKLQNKNREILVNNLNNFFKYVITLLTLYPQASTFLCPEKFLVLLQKVSLDSHVIDSILNVTVVQCVSVVLSCYSENEWNSTKMDQLCQSFLAITDDHCNWCKIVTNIGNITTCSRQLQKQFARTVLRIKTSAMTVSDGISDLEFVIAFIQTLYNQKEEYNLKLVYCLMDVLSMFVSPLELSKERESDLSNLIDYLSLLSSRIHDNPGNPITGFVKDSILRLRNVLQCIPGQQLQQQSILTYLRET